jgi:hypothetical protein
MGGGLDLLYREENQDPSFHRYEFPLVYKGLRARSWKRGGSNFACKIHLSKILLDNKTKLDSSKRFFAHRGTSFALLQL